MNTVKQRFEHIKKLTCIAMFCSLAYIVSFCFPIKVEFLTFDAKDSIIAIGGMFFGPLSAAAMSVIVPILEMPSSSTGFLWFDHEFSVQRSIQHYCLAGL